MFEDSLLIIKPDYILKRKPVLLTLLQKDFLIQGSRKLSFSPEDAAEFYKNLGEDEDFMLKVILLSKGSYCEAFILTKENAVEELVSTMVCYFGTSKEMERYVHVTNHAWNVQFEICFIFPNYIHEPIPDFSGNQFCQNSLMMPLMSEIYDIYQKSDEKEANWRVQLAEWLTLSNKKLPRISNQCSRKPTIKHEEKAQQSRNVEPLKEPCALKVHHTSSSEHSSSVSYSSAGSSMIMTSSSCITCSCFDGTDTCREPPPTPPRDPCEPVLEQLDAAVDAISDLVCEHVCEEEIEWLEIDEDESDDGHAFCGGLHDELPVLPAYDAELDEEVEVAVYEDKTEDDPEPQVISEPIAFEPETQTEKAVTEEPVTEPEPAHIITAEPEEAAADAPEEINAAEDVALEDVGATEVPEEITTADDMPVEDVPVADAPEETNAAEDAPNENAE